MTKFQLDRDDAPWDYPAYGFRADTADAILDGSLFTPPITEEPDAFWTVYGGGSAQTGITLIPDTDGNPPVSAYPTDASLPVHRRQLGGFDFLTPAEWFADEEIAAGVSAGLVTGIEDVASDIGVALSAGFISYAPAPSGGDDRAILQALIDALAATNGGTLMLRTGTYRVDAPLYIANKVIVRGTSRSSTIIQAGGSFAGAFVAKLGPSSGLCFHSRLEHLTLDVNNHASAIGVYSAEAQEMCGLSYVVVTNFQVDGIKFETNVANVDLDNIEVYPKSTGATRGINAIGISGSNSLRRITVGVSGALTTGILMNGGSAVIQSVHAENCTNGVYMDGANGSLIGVTGPTALTNVTNLVRMSGTSRYVAAQAVTKNGATNAILDDFFGTTITEAYVPHWVGGDLWVARLREYVGTRERKTVDMLAGYPDAYTGGALSWSATASMIGNGFVQLNNTVNNYMEFEVELSVGTWAIDFYHATSTDQGIITAKIAGASVGTVDTYSASLTWNVRTSLTGIAVTTPGRKTFRVEMATKNASSTGYVLRIGTALFRRTA